MTLGTISICLTVVVLNVHHRGARNPVPGWIKKLVFSYLMHLVCVSRRRSQGVREKVYAKRSMKKVQSGESKANGVVDEMELLSLTVNTTQANGPRSLAMANNIAKSNSVDQGGGDDDEPNYSRDWHDLAHVLDRLFFWILLIAMTVTGALILLYPRYMGIIT